MPTFVYESLPIPFQIKDEQREVKENNINNYNLIYNPDLVEDKDIQNKYNNDNNHLDDNKQIDIVNNNQITAESPKDFSLLIMIKIKIFL